MEGSLQMKNSEVRVGSTSSHHVFVPLDIPHSSIHLSRRSYIRTARIDSSTEPKIMAKSLYSEPLPTRRHTTITVVVFIIIMAKSNKSAPGKSILFLSRWYRRFNIQDDTLDFAGCTGFIYELEHWSVRQLRGDKIEEYDVSAIDMSDCSDVVAKNGIYSDTESGSGVLLLMIIYSTRGSG
jgi:hypothetical protein